jgi:hypothetical protein
MMAALLLEKTHGMMTGMKRDWRSPALLMPITPAILLPSLTMYFSSEETTKANPQWAGWAEVVTSNKILAWKHHKKFQFRVRFINPMNKIKIQTHFHLGSQLLRHIGSQVLAIIGIDLIFNKTQKGAVAGANPWLHWCRLYGKSLGV